MSAVLDMMISKKFYKAQEGGKTVPAEKPGNIDIRSFATLAEIRELDELRKKLAHNRL